MKRILSLVFITVSLIMVLPSLSLPRALAASPNTTPTFPSSPQQLDLLQSQDDTPSTLMASNGTMWISWQNYPFRGYYETYSSKYGWSSTQPLPTGSNYVINPAFGQLANSSIILVWSTNTTGHWGLYYKLYNGQLWGSTTTLTSSPLWNDFNPRVTLGSNSTLWVFWERHPATNNSTLIYYKTLTGNKWSSDTRLSPIPPPNGLQDHSPDAVATNDGRIWVAWSRFVSSNTSDIYYRYYDGKVWQSEIRLTNANSLDMNPAIAQDRNGTLWIVWSRPLFLGIDPSTSTAVYQQKLFYKTSFDGINWSPDTQLTFYGNLNTPLDDSEPSVVMGFDKSLYIFYSSDYPQESNFNIFYLKSSSISPVHNAAIVQVLAPQVGYQNSVVTVLVTVRNLGDFSETIYFNITATNSTTYTVASMVPESLPLGSTMTYTFGWNTANVPLGKYSFNVAFSLANQPLLLRGGDKAQWSYTTLIVLEPLPPCRIDHACIV